MRTRTIERVLWFLFGTSAVLIAIGSIFSIKSDAFWLVATYLPLLILIGHACLTLTPRRGLCFIFGAALTGYLAESISLHNSTLFGGTYTYPETAALSGVPLAVIAYWAVFIYMGYWLVNSFLVWRNKAKPSKDSASFSALALLILFDGLAVTAIDLLMDPVNVALGKWTWTSGGSYYGVPLGNFVGWFFVTILVTGCFRIYEYYRPQRQLNWRKSIILLPVLGYLLTGLTFLADSVRLHMWSLAGVGAMIVLLPAIVSLVVYYFSRHRSTKA
ncbi:carotenoid biosynthesis protein [Candidatus Saccharibacteria bacterium]|nr:MAG: carotenoid biosynthesis protein [Candidatus Saccharibacteria bacterium]